MDATSRIALSQDFNSLRAQITIITQNASFNGTNLIDAGADEIVAITSPDALQKITISHENLTLAGGNIVLTAAQSVATLTAAAAAVTDVSTSLSNVNAVLTRLGAGGKSLEAQRTFATKISDTIEVGIGNLVDADLARESARLQSLQVKQQLGCSGALDCQLATSINFESLWWLSLTLKEHSDERQKVDLNINLLSLRRVSIEVVNE